jgi:two-component system chemotaxis sensor kinase CheA
MLEHDDLLSGFIEDSQQHLQSIEPDLLALESDAAQIDPDAVNRIFRSVHSVKGAAGFFGLQNISRLSHAMESVLSLLREKKIAPSPKLTDALLSGVDALKAMLEDVNASESFDLHEELSYLKILLDENTAADSKVTVKEKSPKHAHLNRFAVPEREMKEILSKGYNLYAVRILLNKDLRDKRKSPFDFINNMESLGRYVDSFLDIQSVGGLSDCLDNELAFDFLFATILERDLVPMALELPKEQIRSIDLDEFHKEAAAAPAPLVPSPPMTETPVSASDEHDSDNVQPPPPASPLPETKSKSLIHADEKIRVSVNFLNELMNLAGELVLGRNQLMQIALPLVKAAPDLSPMLQHISRVISEMQEKVMLMRMQPMSLLFGKFPRVVRDMAKNRNKEIKLITHGEDVELDKSIIEGLSDPLTHLIRNSADHGIEPPEEREKLGKPRYGTIRLKAYHQGGQVHLDISDDGRGIDGNLVAEKAIQKGIITREQMKTMTPKDRVRLIFRAGFSTADHVTDLSGRGVGMDVVMTNIEQMGGTVSIDTEPGKGTTIRLVLPLTLAIVSGLLIRANHHFFILPESEIDELVRVKPEDIPSRINIVQDASVLRLRDALVPLVDLNKILGFESDRRSLSDTASPVRIVMVRYGKFRFGLIVEAILNMEEIVVKPLPRYLKKIKRFSGVTILGNGTVSLILDAAGILDKAAIRYLEDENDLGIISEVSETKKEIQTLLLFDNRTNERFALPLELISRIERVSASQIERIRDKQFLQYHDKKLRLIFLEDYLPITRPQRCPDDTIGVIIPKQIRQPIGIVMDKVINTIQTAVELDTQTIMAPGLFGSAVLDGKITLLPDMYQLFELAAPEWYTTEKTGKKDARRKRRVLLAEDTPFFRMIESDYLISAGYEVITAENGKKALQILEEQESVDAAILDIVMPEMDGLETLRAIRANERLKHLPVMAVTSLSDGKVAEEGLKLGFDEWELKLDKIRLLEKLAGLIAKKTSPRD